MSTITNAIRTAGLRPSAAAIIFLAVTVVLASIVVLVPRTTMAEARFSSGLDSSIQAELSQGERLLNGSKYGPIPAFAEKRTVTDRLMKESKYGGDVALPVQQALAPDRMKQESKYGGDAALPVKRDPAADRLKQESKYGG